MSTLTINFFLLSYRNTDTDIFIRQVPKGTLPDLEKTSHNYNHHNFFCLFKKRTFDPLMDQNQSELFWKFI